MIRREKMDLRRDILIAAKQKGIDPYKDPFSPKDLCLRASDYGSISDYCQETESAKWNSKVILRPVKFGKTGKPRTYILIK